MGLEAKIFSDTFRYFLDLIHCVCQSNEAGRGASLCMVRLEERLSFGSSRRAKPLCWVLLPKQKDLGCQAESRHLNIITSFSWTLGLASS
jgi:hypothetical protein